MDTVSKTIFEHVEKNGLQIKIEDVDVGPAMSAVIDANEDKRAIEDLSVLVTTDYLKTHLKEEISNKQENNNLVTESKKLSAAKNIYKNDCKQRLPRKVDVYNHLISQPEENLYSCCVCGSLFIDKKDLVTHMAAHNFNKCKHCGRQFSRASSLANHIKIHNYQPGRAINPHRISDTNELEDILIGNSDLGLQFSINNSSSGVVNEVLNNITWNMTYEPTNCKDIMNLSEISSTADGQIDTMNKEKDFVCAHCEQTFASGSALELHLKCCGIQNKLKSKHAADPTDNIKESDPENSKCSEQHKHVCKLCDKGFCSKGKLLQHSWVHRKKLYPCDMCSSNFDSQDKLDLHRLNKHSFGFDYICDKCGKNFFSKQGLWQHNKTHQDAKKTYDCEECNKSFNSRQGIVIHQRKHSDERPYGCKYCQKSFRDGGTLRKHERTHTGERPHACPICPKAFNQKVLLRDHIQSQHTRLVTADAAGKFLCMLCLYEFSEKDFLTAHIMDHSDKLAQLAKRTSRNNVRENAPVT